jgi:hypothetical protein
VCARLCVHVCARARARRTRWSCVCIGVRATECPAQVATGRGDGRRQTSALAQRVGGRAQESAGDHSLRPHGSAMHPPAVQLRCKRPHAQRATHCVHPPPMLGSASL